ncbi:AT-rich interactive domain-containing protein 2 isoform X2 [Procambarus clarkii]|uniref:AT-rich interactive domain-containing protein 2 isoform X2 n=1 Tax=Procambarus clarkii TaxID=6728 RepID=UPI001E6732D8|nr:AT-rich interactive domain-containing protein 2-like isoform X2 [Procambarus clarkii]
MTKEMNKDAEAYDREYDGFLKQLEEFHQQRGTAFKRLPRINGKGVDLYLLYVVVTARGGWQKVNARCEWEDILEDFRLPAGCVNSATALKHIYIRYLDAYERINFLGEDGEERGAEMDDGEDSRLMRTKRAIRSLNTVPLCYNHQQHNVLESIRGGSGLSVEVYRPSLYDKLALSLISPLPNEHDFAFNVCTILSNEGRHVMQLSQCPRLIEHMLGHTGVYKDWETQKYFLNTYKETKGRSLVQFWIDSLCDNSVLDLLIPDSVDQPLIIEEEEEEVDLCRFGFAGLGSSGAIDSKNVHSLSSDSLANFDDKENFLCEDTCEPTILRDSCITSETNLILENRFGSGCFEQIAEPIFRRISADSITQLKKETISKRLKKLLECEGSDLKLAKEDIEIFHLGRDLGTQDPEGTRISQILHIIRNLSFEEQNVPSLAKSQTCLRFLVLCICSQWGGLAVNALDTLGNIAPEVKLRDPKIDSCSASLLAHVCKGVSSPDRAFVLRCLEVLNKLAMNDPNEEVLSNNIDSPVYGQICRYLTIHDIMLLIYTLECLYSLSSLGTQACNAIVRATGSIHTLISLLTVEAQSYGPEACIGMKVVETVTGVVSEPEPVTPPPPPPPPPPTPAPVVTAVTAAPAPAPPPVTPVVPVSNTVPAPPVATVAPKTPITKPLPPAAASPPTPTTTTTTAATMAATLAAGGDPKKLAARIVPPEVEEFVKEWVMKNYEACNGNAIEQAIVYRHFAASMHSMGRKQGLNPVLLSNCVRKVFGTGVGPSRRPVDEGAEKWHYNGIRRRDGVVVPPMPEKKRGMRINSTIPVYTPTPVIPAVNTINAQVTEGRTMGSIMGSPQLVSATTAQTDGIISPSSPILKAQLSAPLRPSPPPPVRPPQGMVSGTMSQGVYSSAQQQQSPQQSQQVQAGSRTDNSALIKSLLANKVSRNIQKQQLQQQHTDNSQDSSSDSQIRKTTSFNGICNEIKRCEDDSNSFLSSGLNDKKVTSFEGILQNGIKSEMDLKEEELETKTKKNVLADLLEKTVGGDILNGVVDRELRISDRGLEFVNHGQQLKVNGPITSNGQTGIESVQGVKRPATPDNTPAKRIALEDPRAGTDSRITLYVSQNGSESGEVISQGHQVVLSQGQQFSPANSTAPQQMVVSQAVLTGQQQGAPTQTVVTPQGQVILQRPGTQTGVIMQQGGQIIQGTSAGQVIQQVIQQGQSGQTQKVILHQGQLGQVLGSQMILSQNSSGQHQVLVQGGNNFQGQVIMQGVPHCQGQVFVQGNSQNQFVMSGNQGQTVVVPGSQGQQVVVSSAQGQTMIVAGNQGQPVVVSGQQGQSGQMVMPGNVGGTVLLAPQQQGSTAKTLIILPNPKMVLAGNQHQGGQGQQLVLPRQVTGQQIVQVVSSGTTVPVASVSTAVRTVHAVPSVTDVRVTPTPPPVQIQSSSGSSSSSNNSSSSSSASTYSAQTSASLPSAIAPAPAGPTAVPVSQTSVSQGPQTPHVPAPQVLASGVARRPGKASGLQYLCEWRGCSQVFSSAGQVYHHACKVHCPPHFAEIQCGWAGCDPMVRRRFSAMTHLHDRHCNEQLLQILAVRRSQLATTGKTDIPIPQTPPPHPGYAPNAAFHAIKRHALEVINQRDAVEKEGPVTKSIRLTAALILRNLVIYSNTGKKLLRGYESELANVALSTMESSRTVAQILYDIRLPDHQNL